MLDLEAVRVAVRVRPLSEAEIAHGYVCVVKVVPSTNADEVQIGDGKQSSDRFAYNHAFGPDASQQELYERAVVQLLDKLFEGFNVTILAYGQTSSGKTFTMGTDFTGMLGDNMGVIPRAVSDIFRMVEERQASEGSVPVPTVTCSFIELYQENVFDLLSRNRQSLDIREASGGVVVLQGLTEVPVSTVEGTLKCLVRGSAGRCVGATAMNSTSSRSHAIFTINITQHSPDDPSSLIKSQFHLVDLAGSERSKKTMTTGDRFKEGVKINQGLLALGNVIAALSSTASHGGGASGAGVGHVSYRDSKLTRLLQHSLGGNSYTLMIACVSPVDFNLNETLSTLRYADRACKIKNKPIVNVDPHRAQVKQFEATILELRLQLAMKNDTTGTGVTQLADTGRSYTMADAARSQHLERKNYYLETQLQSMLQSAATNEIRAQLAEKTIEDIEAFVLQNWEAGKTSRLATTDSTNCDNDDDVEVGDDKDANQTDKKENDYQSLIGSMLKAYREERFALGDSSWVSSGAKDDVESSLDSTTMVLSNSPQLDVIQQASDNYTHQQIRMHNELHQLNQELAVKETLQRRCLALGEADSPNKILSMTRLSEQLLEYQTTIQALEAQLNQQKELLKASEKMSKLAEKRRCNVRELEAKVAAAQKEKKRLESLAKDRESMSKKNAEQAKDIKEMKATRIKLLKKMDLEQANFKKFKDEHKKKMCQLEAQGRKQQGEMQKMATTYTKQQAAMQRKMQLEQKKLLKAKEAEKVVLQRRMLQVEAANRRLLAAREHCKGSFGGTRTDRSVLRGAEAMRWVEHELELIHSSVDATETLRLLSKHRDKQAIKLAQLEAEAKQELSGPKAEMLAGDIAHCENGLELRNDQIADLEQKLRLTDIDELLTMLSTTLATLPEARQAFRRVLDAMVQKDAQLVEERFQTAELQIANELYQEELRISDAPNTNDNPEEQDDDERTVTVPEEYIFDYYRLRDELMLYKERNHQLERLSASQSNDAVEPLCKKPKLSRQFSVEKDEEKTEDEETDDEDEPGEIESAKELERDPTFRGTPISKRKKSETNLSSSRSIGNSSVSTHGYCSCSGICSTKRCGCRKVGLSCAESCKCPEGCVNKNNSKTEMPPPPPPHRVENAENTTETIVNHTLNQSTKNVVHAASKNCLNEEMDILTYVQRNKKRKPLIDM